MLAAISQSYISQWLAQPQEISGQKKKAMYTWFISEKRKTVGMSNGNFTILFTEYQIIYPMNHCY